MAVALAACSVVSTQRSTERAVDSLQREIDSGVVNGLFVKTAGSLRCGDGRAIADVVLYSDASGKPRKYGVSDGSGDSARATSYYYSSGVLRLIVQESAAVNGSARELRVYFDSAGQRVADLERRNSGPGWTFAAPDEIRNPSLDLQGLQDRRGAFAASCGEG
jgi:hypothetical protein